MSKKIYLMLKTNMTTRTTNINVEAESVKANRLIADNVVTSDFSVNPSRVTTTREVQGVPNFTTDTNFIFFRSGGIKYMSISGFTAVANGTSQNFIIDGAMTASFIPENLSTISFPVIIQIDGVLRTMQMSVIGLLNRIIITDGMSINAGQIISFEPTGLLPYL